MRDRIKLVTASFSGCLLDLRDDTHAMLCDAVEEIVAAISVPDLDDIERVCRALCISDGLDPDEHIAVHRSYAESVQRPRWKTYDEDAMVALKAYFA